MAFHLSHELETAGSEAATDIISKTRQTIAAEKEKASREIEAQITAARKSIQAEAEILSAQCNGENLKPEAELMKNGQYRRFLFRWLPFILLSLHLLAIPAFAAGETGGWRSTYDEIMRWLNFGIFVLVIVKFARIPLANFLKGRKRRSGR